MACRETGGNAVGKPCASCGDLDVVLAPCGRWPTRGSHVCTSHGSAPKHARAAAARTVARQEAETAITKHRARLGVAAPDESHEVTALTMIRQARGNVAAWQGAVDALVDAGDADIVASLAVHTGNPKKPNEVEKHFALARLDEERDRLMDWIAVARKLGIEEARLEQVERLSKAQGERIVVIIRTSIDGYRAALLARGVELDVIDVVHREVLPALVRDAIAATDDEVGG